MQYTKIQYVDDLHPKIRGMENNEVRIIIVGKIATGKSTIAQLLKNTLLSINPDAKLTINDEDGDLDKDGLDERLKEVLEKNPIHIEFLQLRDRLDEYTNCTKSDSE